jgi:hypothetical protein
MDGWMDIIEGYTITAIIYKHMHNTSLDERLNILMYYHSRITHTIHICMMVLIAAQGVCTIDH